MKTKEKNCNYRQDTLSYLSQVFKIFCSMKMHAIEAKTLTVPVVAIIPPRKK